MNIPYTNACAMQAQGATLKRYATSYVTVLDRVSPSFPEEEFPRAEGESRHATFPIYGTSRRAKLTGDPYPFPTDVPSHFASAKKDHPRRGRRERKETPRRGEDTPLRDRADKGARTSLVSLLPREWRILVHARTVARPSRDYRARFVYKFTPAPRGLGDAASYRIT